jgi:hypothetical protein
VLPINKKTVATRIERKTRPQSIRPARMEAGVVAIRLLGIIKVKKAFPSPW